MGKVVITDDDRKEFRNTVNGKNKLRWLRLGIIIDLITTLSACLVTIYREIFKSTSIYLLVLYTLLVIVVLGGEFIGTYYGALEQYVIDKNSKKAIDYIDS